MLSGISAQLLTVLGGLVAVIVAGIGLFFKGRSSGKQEQVAKENKAYIDTRKRVDNVKTDTSGSDAELLKRLREHEARK